ncbi:hypothetical protein DY000_02014300 [Brassica cretica]|uniref:Uncharacterized protein n=1 Tax=Brassica cretica TaxID=69181 RepID=A0ABQ7CQI4_BRACR|nr:hypothetical protein DY000_02014300 [Brassica cretica]
MEIGVSSTRVRSTSNNYSNNYSKNMSYGKKQKEGISPFAPALRPAPTPVRPQETSELFQDIVRSLELPIFDKESAVQVAPDPGHWRLDPRWKEPRFPGSPLEGTLVPAMEFFGPGPRIVPFLREMENFR